MQEATENYAQLKLCLSKQHKLTSVYFYLTAFCIQNIWSKVSLISFNDIIIDTFENVPIVLIH